MKHIFQTSNAGSMMKSRRKLSTPARRDYSVRNLFTGGPSEVFFVKNRFVLHFTWKLLQKFYIC